MPAIVAERRDGVFLQEGSRVLVVAEQEISPALAERRRARLSAEGRVVDRPRAEHLDRLFGLAGVAIKVDQARFHQRGVGPGAFGLFQFVNGHAGRPLPDLVIGDGDRVGLLLGGRFAHGVLNPQHRLVELREVLRKLGALIGSEVVGGRRLDRGLKSVAGQIEEIRRQIKLVHLHVQRLEVVASVRGRLRRSRLHGVVQRGDSLAEPGDQQVRPRAQLLDPGEVLRGELEAPQDGHFLGHQGPIGGGEQPKRLRIVGLGGQRGAGFPDRQETARGIGEGGDAGNSGVSAGEPALGRVVVGLWRSQRPGLKDDVHPGHRRRRAFGGRDRLGDLVGSQVRVQSV